MLEALLKLSGVIETTFAQVRIQQSIELPKPFGDLTLSEIAGKIADALILVGGPLVAIMVLIGGYYMVTSAGNPEKFGMGKKTILYAAVGLVILLAAKGIATVVQNILD